MKNPNMALMSALAAATSLQFTGSNAAKIGTGKMGGFPLQSLPPTKRRQLTSNYKLKSGHQKPKESGIGARETARRRKQMAKRQEKLLCEA